MNVLGRIAPAPHNPANVKRWCWTCLHQMGTVGQTTLCTRSGKPVYKGNLDPCEHYELNAVWLEVDWWFPPYKKEESR